MAKAVIKSNPTIVWELDVKDALFIKGLLQNPPRDENGEIVDTQIEEFYERLFYSLPKFEEMNKLHVV